MKKLLLLFLFLSLLSTAQTKKIYLSAPFDRLILEKTSLHEAKKILGPPSKTRRPAIIEHTWERRLELDYNRLNSTLRFGRPHKILYSIELDSASGIMINDVIKTGIADTSLLLKTFGTPASIYRLSDFPYYFYALDPYDVYFSWDDKGILQSAAFFNHFQEDTTGNYIVEDTSTTSFGVNVEHVDDALPGIKVVFKTGNDTVSSITNAQGIAEVRIPKRVYPAISIHAKGYRDYDVQVTKKFMDEQDYVYKRIHLVALSDSIFDVRRCDPMSLFAVSDSTLKVRCGSLPLPDSLPAYKDGIAGLQKYFKANPLKDKYSGVTIFDISIAFIINCDGSAGSYQLISSRGGVYEIYGNHIIDIARKIPGAWQPALKNGKPVDCYQVLTFKVINSKLGNVTYKTK